MTKGETKLLSKDFFTEGKNWNVILFLNPVGSAAKTSLPRTMFSITSICLGFNSFMPGKTLYTKCITNFTWQNAILHWATKIPLDIELREILFWHAKKAVLNALNTWHDCLARTTRDCSGLDKFQAQQVMWEIGQKAPFHPRKRNS